MVVLVVVVVVVVVVVGMTNVLGTLGGLFTPRISESAVLGSFFGVVGWGLTVVVR